MDTSVHSACDVQVARAILRVSVASTFRDAGFEQVRRGTVRPRKNRAVVVKPKLLGDPATSADGAAANTAGAAQGGVAGTGSSADASAAEPAAAAAMSTDTDGAAGDAGPGSSAPAGSAAKQGRREDADPGTAAADSEARPAKRPRSDSDEGGSAGEEVDADESEDEDEDEEICPITLATEATEAFLTSVLYKGQKLSELASREQVNVVDMAWSLDANGVPMEDLHEFLTHFVKLSKPEGGAPVLHLDPPVAKDEKFTAPQHEPLVSGEEHHIPDRLPHAPDYLVTLPEPHTYMQTPVYYPPLTDYGTWRRRKSDEQFRLMESMAKLAVGMTIPAPKPLQYSLPRGTPKLPAVISRPRRSTPFLTQYITGKDPPNAAPPVTAESAELAEKNPYTLPAAAEADPDKKPIFGLGPAPLTTSLTIS